MSNLSDDSPPVRTMTLDHGGEIQILGFNPPRTFGWLSDAYGALRREGLHLDIRRTAEMRRETGQPFLEVWSDAYSR